MPDRKLPLPADQPSGRRPLLSRILKAIRRRRGLLSQEVADRMGLPLRTYEHFEAGGGRLNLARLQSFAEATDSDAYAIVASLAFGEIHFALRCADNKAMTIAMMAIQDLDREVGDDLALLDARRILHEFDAACGRLAEEARSRRFPGPRDGPAGSAR
ncbi:helix-turn-helix domain-containing protein [Phenylobacterium terrae]|uniref:helix-turn-helix domain-containing protein n=1 Tax=Phenylobacterium terrae TaxID=2665495 RepID=UPI0036735B6D